MGRLDSVTNGRFQVSEFNDSFPAMNLKSGRSPGDPNQKVAEIFQASKNGKQADSHFYMIIQLDFPGRPLINT